MSRKERLGIADLSVPDFRTKENIALDLANIQSDHINIPVGMSV